MEKNEALDLLASGAELTKEQRERIAQVLEKAEVYGDDEWNGSAEEWWNSSEC